MGVVSCLDRFGLLLGIKRLLFVTRSPDMLTLRYRRPVGAKLTNKGFACTLNVLEFLNKNFKS